MLSGLTARAYRRTKQTNDLCGIEIEHQHIDDSLVRATMNGDKRQCNKKINSMVCKSH